jgi:hypothetical protein
MAAVRKLQPQYLWQVERLLDPGSVADALAGYLTLHHPPERTSIYGYYPGGDQLTGFLAFALTGIDLFRPLAVPFVASEEALHALLQAALRPGRPVLLYLPFDQEDWLPEQVHLSDMRLTEIYRLDPTRFRPLINVLVTNETSPDGAPRKGIRGRDGASAVAGINWKGGKYAEIYLDFNERGRERGFHLAVLHALCAELLAEHKVPLYRLGRENHSLRQNLEAIGFRMTTVRTLVSQAVWREEREEGEV